MRLITITVRPMGPADTEPVAAFRNFLGAQMTYEPATQATAAFVIISRAREKLSRAAGGAVEITTTVNYAEHALAIFRRFKDPVGPWLTALQDELRSGIEERLAREKSKERRDAERDFDVVARRARTVREHRRLHRQPADEVGGDG